MYRDKSFSGARNAKRPTSGQNTKYRDRNAGNDAVSQCKELMKNVQKEKGMGFTPDLSSSRA
jgi:hypothetical protein